MALSGPRLDRPSAIGDEGRPRAASLWIASFVVCALVGVCGVLMDWPSLLPSLATIVGTTAAGVALLQRDRFVELLVGQAMLVGFGSVLALIVFVAPIVDRVGLAGSGFAVALFGIAIAWADVGNRDGLKRAATASALSFAAMWLWIFVLAVGFLVLAVVWASLSGIVDQSSPVAAVVGFAFVTGCSAIVVRLSLRWLPVLELAPRDRRSAVEAHLAAIRRATLLTTIASIGLFVIGGLLWAGDWFGPLDRRLPLLGDALVALSSPWIVGPIAAVGTVSLLAGILAVSLRWLANSTDATSARRVSAGLVGLPLALLVFLGTIVAATLTSVYVGLLVVAATVLGPLLLALAFGTGLAGVSLGLVPDRAGGPAIAAAGLVIAAVGFGNGPPPLVFACVAGALLVWDVSAFGLGLTAELGHVPETRRLELFHGVIAVGIAALAAGVAIGLDLVRTSTAAGIGGTPALIAIALGALVLLIPLRG